MFGSLCAYLLKIRREKLRSNKQQLKLKKIFNIYWHVTLSCARLVGFLCKKKIASERTSWESKGKRRENERDIPCREYAPRPITANDVDADEQYNCAVQIDPRTATRGRAISTSNPNHCSKTPHSLPINVLIRVYDKNHAHTHPRHEFGGGPY
jgi:hypothetical protein